MNLWLTIIAIGVLTYAIRLSFILVLDQQTFPPLLQRALRLVPAAVLSALILPDLLIQHDQLNFSLGNPRLVAGVVAALVAWRTRNVLLTVGLGMTLLFLLQWLAGRS
jgi:branched-subunit amino acid transport protein